MTAYWYCIKHNTVEAEDEGCANKDRLGPYDTYAEAADALDLAARRTEEWENDPDWNDDVDPGVDPGRDQGQ